MPKIYYDDFVMTKPAPRSRLAPIVQLQRPLLWLCFAMILLAVGADILLGKGFLLAKGVAAGAGLAFLLHFIFIKFASKARGKGNEMLLAIYMGEIAKWVFAFLGFAIIFKFGKPISTGAVFVGFIAMQIAAMASTFFGSQSQK